MAREAAYPGDGSYPDSYYAASRNDTRERAPLRDRAETDIAIVGAGYSGLSAAIHLAEKGHRVAIVEGARVG